MFGGLAGVGGPDAEKVLGDTWAWTATGWLELHPAASPPARSGGSLGYDPTGKRMILYGGGNNFYSQSIDPARNDTWAWDGSTWTELHPEHQPTAATCCSPTEMVTDPATPALWLTMGLLQMWSWTGSDWAVRTPAPRPPERFEYGLAFDEQLGGVVAVCGYAGEGVPANGEAAPYHDDTWLWKAGSWAEILPSTKPGRGPCVAVYDAAHAELVVFSGFYGTFTYSRGTWTARHPAHVPPIESETAAFAYDPKTQQSVLVGGNPSAQQPEDLNQTWSWDGIDWTHQP